MRFFEAIRDEGVMGETTKTFKKIVGDYPSCADGRNKVQRRVPAQMALFVRRLNGARPRRRTMPPDPC